MSTAAAGSVIFSPFLRNPKFAQPCSRQQAQQAGQLGDGEAGPTRASDWGGEQSEASRKRQDENRFHGWVVSSLPQSVCYRNGGKICTACYRKVRLAGIAYASETLLSCPGRQGGRKSCERLQNQHLVFPRFLLLWRKIECLRSFDPSNAFLAPAPKMQVGGKLNCTLFRRGICQ